MVEQVAFQTVFQFLQTVGILVGVFYYVMTIRANQRNQELTLKAQEQAVETRQAQLFMQIFSRFDEEWVDAYQEILMLDFNNFQEYWEYASPRTNTELSRKFYRLNSLYEGLGLLVREGLLNIRLVYPSLRREDDFSEFPLAELDRISPL